ncbi:potassium-transporting ATPase subunit KdpA [Flectobacillus roseus]|uniref:Potassium-transporting ATPase potassium-binding subunit n=1 Tax=Flectobacillus roseus TaxID=502259 RepID=A0ABT6YEP4_9BACT|nr:potassium-transporting ATPase subunit KdpA [Flectobacillus roseus]MDI9861626.1 potassium-transporting ATPase subunit KdpA [Flectobacillus roseus]
METDLLGIIATFVLTILLAWPLGKYISAIYTGAPHWSDKIFGGMERLFYKIGGINPKLEMTWQESLKALLSINLIWFLFAMFILMNQGWLPWNPDHNPSMSPDLAFNTAVSFLVNCNLQHYSGETGMSYLGQITCLMFLQFVTAATGMAACAVVFKAMREQTSQKLGNFYTYFIQSNTRILLPLALIVASLLLFEGVPMNIEGKASIHTLEGNTVQVARGPAAAMVAIKQLGTNGGGFFGANSSHPLENPTYWSNAVESISIILIPIAMVFALGFYLNRKKLAWVIFGVMTVGFLALIAPALYFEWQGNPAVDHLGVAQNLGNMEGKETRFGTTLSTYWAIITTVTSNGSVNAMHDSLMPLTGMSALLGMMINALYGGVGVGFLNFYVFIIIAVFIAGLMVGRTPELFGKKIEAREMKIATLIALLHPFLILLGTAIASYVAHQKPDIGWLNNPGFHGFSEMLYEYTSSAANNGSGFEGLGDNTPFWNISTGIVLILSRYIPIIGPVAIAGILAKKKHIPSGAGTLQLDTLTFGILMFAVILILVALAFFPALTLGPLAEHFSLK